MASDGTAMRRDENRENSDACSIDGRILTPDATLTDLRRRIQATRWPERELVSDASQLISRAFDGTPGGITQEEIRS